MGSKKANYLELFIDKIVLAAAGIIAVIILFVFVLREPKIDGEGPSEIDDAINRRADNLEQRLNEDPNEKIHYVSNQTEYLSLLANSIKDINSRIFFPLAGSNFVAPESLKFTYQIPQIGQIAKPASAVARMAAFVPTEDISTTVAYENAEKRLEDLDLVTIESSIDVKSLYSKFKESFAARNFPVEKRKEQYAKPVFAKVQLQRQTLQSDGNWSEWSDVPLTKICSLKKNLEVPKEPSEYGIEMALVQFAKGDFRDEILQPDVYCNALPSEMWISPSFYNGRQVKLNKYQEEIRRQQIEEEKTKKLQERNNATSTRETRQQQTTTTTTLPARNSGDMGGPGGGGGGGRSSSRSSSRRETATRTTTTRNTSERTTERASRSEKTSVVSLPNITENADFALIKLDADTNLENLDKLVFWAHDDTTKPGEKYKYRIRIGVFNPIAGRDCFTEEQKDYRNQVVLWSDFAEAGNVIEIPQRLYFFATDVRGDVDKSSSTDKTVEVTVARYTLGNWASKKYNVKSGEEIGRADEPADARLEQAGISSDAMDFSTGAVMIDARRVTEWYGTNNLRSRDYYELLYSFDGRKIEKTPIRERFWSDKVTQIYKEISASLGVQPVTLLSWEQASSGRSSHQAVQQKTTDETQPYSPESGRQQRSPDGIPQGQGSDLTGPGMP